LLPGSAPVAEITADPNMHATQVALLALGSTLAFLLLNPFLAMLLVALVGLSWRVPPLAVILPASVSFTLFFYFRHYGVDWYAESTDDVPQYIALYETNRGVPLSQVFLRFIEKPSGNEPLWHLPLWVLMNGFNASADTFVFLQYFTIFLLLFCALTTFSSRHLPAFAVVYFFLIPISLESLSFVFRQQIAFSMFLAGIGLVLVRRRPIGYWILFLTPLMHLSCVFYLAIFLLFDVLNRYGAFDKKLRATVLLVGAMLAVPAVAQVAIQVLDSMGFGRVMDYILYSDNMDRLRIYLLMGVYASSQLAAFYLLRNDAANNLITVLCIAVFSIVLAIPTGNAVYDRLLLFVLPLLSLHLFRCLIQNFAPVWRIPAVLLAFIIGTLRVYGPATEGYGPGAFLAFGHAYDPAMGILKMITTL
jgi:hypothetical protein